MMSRDILISLLRAFVIYLPVVSLLILRSPHYAPQSNIRKTIHFAYQSNKFIAFIWFVFVTILAALTSPALLTIIYAILAINGSLSAILLARIYSDTQLTT